MWKFAYCIPFSPAYRYTLKLIKSLCQSSPSRVHAFSAVCPLVPFPRPFSWPFTELQNGRPLRSVDVPVSCSLSQDSFEWENQSPFLFTLAPKLFCSVYVRPAFSCCWRKRGGWKANHVVVSELERFILPWPLDISPEQ